MQDINAAVVTISAIMSASSESLYSYTIPFALIWLNCSASGKNWKGVES